MGTRLGSLPKNCVDRLTDCTRNDLNSVEVLTNNNKVELVFVKPYAPNICLSPNMAKFAVS